MIDWRQIVRDIKAAGLTQMQISERTGISQSYVSDLETGNRGKNIGFDKAMKLQALWNETRTKADEQAASA